MLALCGVCSGTALMFAAAGGHKAVAELLIAHKADVNAVVKATPEYKEQVEKALKVRRQNIQVNRADGGACGCWKAGMGRMGEPVRSLMSSWAVGVVAGWHGGCGAAQGGRHLTHGGRARRTQGGTSINT